MAIGISTTIKPLTAHAAYTTVTEGGKYTVHDIIVYATGKELTSATGQMNAVYRRATSVVKRQYGSVSAEPYFYAETLFRYVTNNNIQRNKTITSSYVPYLSPLNPDILTSSNETKNCFGQSF